MDLKEIEKLIELIEKSNIDEFEIMHKGDITKIKLKKNSASPPVLSSDVVVAPENMQTIPHHYGKPAQTEVPKTEPKDELPAEETKKIYELKSPIVGTFYRAPSPDAEPFVEVGSYVKKGTTLCIIEAMKIMNEIEAEISGKIVKILIENAQPVEYGDVLFHIEPS